MFEGCLREIQEEASLPCLVIRSSWVVQGKHTLLFTSISNKVDDLWTSGMNKKQLFGALNLVKPPLPTIAASFGVIVFDL